MLPEEHVFDLIHGDVARLRLWVQEQQISYLETAVLLAQELARFDDDRLLEDEQFLERSIHVARDCVNDDDLFLTESGKWVYSNSIGDSKETCACDAIETFGFGVIWDGIAKFVSSAKKEAPV